MQADRTVDVLLEAMEVLLNHILYVRGVYPSQIFKKRRVFNTPVFASTFPPLNNYLAGVLRSAKELLARGELQCLEVILYHKEDQPRESYQLQVESLEEPSKDPHLMDYEQQLRSAIYKLAERMKKLPRLSQGSYSFKVHLYTSQDAFVRFSHDSQFQEFPWLQARHLETPGNPHQKISLLPLVGIEKLGLKMQARIYAHV